MYSVQPKLLKHCTLTVRGVSIIYYLSPIREELHWVLKYIGAASFHSEGRSNTDRLKQTPIEEHLQMTDS